MRNTSGLILIKFQSWKLFSRKKMVNIVKSSAYFFTKCKNALSEWTVLFTRAWIHSSNLWPFQCLLKKDPTKKSELGVTAAQNVIEWEEPAQQWKPLFCAFTLKTEIAGLGHHSYKLLVCLHIVPCCLRAPVAKEPGQSKAGIAAHICAGVLC